MVTMSLTPRREEEEEQAGQNAMVGGVGGEIEAFATFDVAASSATVYARQCRRRNRRYG
jgi:hypothetical protein